MYMYMAKSFRNTAEYPSKVFRFTGQTNSQAIPALAFADINSWHTLFDKYHSKSLVCAVHREASTTNQHIGREERSGERRGERGEGVRMRGDRETERRTTGKGWRAKERKTE